MRLTDLPGAPRGLVLLVAVVTIVPLALLLWLGWRVLAQDHVLEQQQIVGRLERGADLAVGSLQKAIAQSQLGLLDGGRDRPPGAVLVSRRRGSIDVTPSSAVAYRPIVAPLPEAAAGLFERGDTLVYQHSAHGAATSEFQRLAASADRSIQAAALVRMAAALRNQNRTEEAVAAYARLRTFDDVGVEGVPAGLAARYGLCRLFEAEGRLDDLRKEAGDLLEALGSGRWPLTASVYELYVTDARRWSGTPVVEPPDAETLADALTMLTAEWPALEPPGHRASGTEVLEVSGRTVVVVWQRSEGAVHALLATERFVEARWLRPLDPLARESALTVALRTPGKPVAVDPSWSAPLVVTRLADDTSLPWTVAVTSTDPPPEQREFAVRRQWLVTGFVVLVLMATAAGLLIVRSVGRERAVARHQSEFVAAVSHEFRTPLTTLRQFTEMLRNQPSADDERRRLAYDAQARATDRLTEMVESLLDFGRMEAGARRYQFEPQDGADLVRRVVDDFRENPAAAAGHDIVFRAGPSARLDADGEAISRAVRNLLENAVKYSPGATPVEVAADRQNGHFRISVRDHGLGIPAHERASIFTKFHRGEQARTLGIRGTGIGLAMVKEIVSAHHGSVEVTSEPGAGSTFTIRLPVARMDG